MREYHKIQSLFKRDPENKYKTFLWNEFTTPEFAYLADLDWRITEKIDGTNIRIAVTQERPFVAGRTDRAELHVDLEAHCNLVGFAAEEAGLAGLTLHGEGYGAGIQKGGGNYRDDKGFILFDVSDSETGRFLEWEDVLDIADQIDVPVVAEYMPYSLIETAKMLNTGGKFVSHIWDGPAEGVVLRPMVNLYDGRGNRIITKLKHRDFLDA